MINIVSLAAQLLEAGGSRLKYTVIGFLIGALTTGYAAHRLSDYKDASVRADAAAITQAAQKEITHAIDEKLVAEKAAASRNVDISALSERLRQSARAASKQPGNSCQRDRRQTSECRRLLAEAVDLLGDSQLLLGQIANDHAIVVKALKK